MAADPDCISCKIVGGELLRLPWTPAPGDRDEIAEAARDLEG